MADPGFPRRGGGAPTLESGVKTYYLTRFLPKLHENERNWTGEGGGLHIPSILLGSTNVLGKLIISIL